MGNSTIIAALQMELGHTVSGMTTDTLNEKRGDGLKLLTTLEAHQSVEHNINANESLSQAGKLDALKKLGTNETAPALKWTKNVIKEMQDKNQRYEQQFFTVDSGLKDMAERMPIFTYLWDRIDRLDPNERIKQFLQSAEQDQVVVLSAMLAHPLGPMINDEVRERALIERAKRLTPNDFTNYEQTQLMLEFLVMARDWIALWLNQEVGVEISVLRTNLGDEVADVLKHQIPAGV